MNTHLRLHSVIKIFEIAETKTYTTQVNNLIQKPSTNTPPPFNTFMTTHTGQISKHSGIFAGTGLVTLSSPVPSNSATFGTSPPTTFADLTHEWTSKISALFEPPGVTCRSTVATATNRIILRKTVHLDPTTPATLVAKLDTQAYVVNTASVSHLVRKSKCYLMSNGLYTNQKLFRPKPKYR
ncbi:unnamed protein product [Rhizopus stolonifer]